jgi:uncharacterized cupredoxin-like copper-binding protein
MSGKDNEEIEPKPVEIGSDDEDAADADELLFNPSKEKEVVVHFSNMTRFR